MQALKYQYFNADQPLGAKGFKNLNGKSQVDKIQQKLKQPFSVLESASRFPQSNGVMDLPIHLDKKHDDQNHRESIIPPKPVVFDSSARNNREIGASGKIRQNSAESNFSNESESFIMDLAENAGNFAKSPKKTASSNLGQVSRRAYDVQSSVLPDVSPDQSLNRRNFRPKPDRVEVDSRKEQLTSLFAFKGDKADDILARTLLPSNKSAKANEQSKHTLPDHFTKIPKLASSDVHSRNAEEHPFGKKAVLPSLFRPKEVPYGGFHDKNDTSHSNFYLKGESNINNNNRRLLRHNPSAAIAQRKNSFWEELFSEKHSPQNLPPAGRKVHPEKREIVPRRLRRGNLTDGFIDPGNDATFKQTKDPGGLFVKSPVHREFNRPSLFRFVHCTRLLFLYLSMA